MKFVDDFRVEERSCTTSELFFKDQSLGMILEVCVLEKAIHYKNDIYLFFFTHDCMFEETVTIMLIDIHQKKIIDSLWIGRMYQTDWMSGVEILNHQQVTFSFLREKPWILTVHEKMKFNFKGIIFFSTVIHRFWFRARLKIR